jgi:S-adenosylmethionine hydrolase
MSQALGNGIEMGVITLLTDFGTQDGYPGVMKGVIWSIVPHVQVADLTHDIPPQDILQGALALARTAPYFPTGTIHVAVVDPGVGTQRRPLAARLGDQYFVCPDNGLLTLLLARAERERASMHFVHLDREEYWLPEISRSFHGRDIFAPVAAHLANGVPLGLLGTPVTDPVRLPLPSPQRTGYGWRAQVIHVDRFGNLATSLSKERVGTQPVLAVRIGGAEIRGLSSAYGDRLPGELVALFDSSGYLSVAVVNGNAAQRLQARPGDPVDISLPDST